MRVAYIVLAHTAPDQLCRLVERLDGDHALFLIHVDKRAPDEVCAEAHRGLSANPRTVFLPRRPSRRTTFGLVAGPLDALKILNRQTEQCDYVILLTGQDYPIKPQSELLTRLEQDPDACFLHAFPMEDQDLSDWQRRELSRYRDWHIWIGDHHWRVPLGRRIPGGRAPFGGSMYWALPRAAMQYVVDVVEREPHLVSFFARTFVPDEMFFQTILMNSVFRDRIATLSAPDCYGLHYIEWRANSNRPETLEVSHLSKLRSTPAFFARKFDVSVDPLVLDRIDTELLDR